MVSIHSTQKLFSSCLCLLVSQTGLISKPKSEGFGLAGQFSFIKRGMKLNFLPWSSFKKKWLNFGGTQSTSAFSKTAYSVVSFVNVHPLCYFTDSKNYWLLKTFFLNTFFLNQWDIWRLSGNLLFLRSCWRYLARTHVLTNWKFALICRFFSTLIDIFIFFGFFAFGFSFLSLVILRTVVAAKQKYIGKDGKDIFQGISLSSFNGVFFVTLTLSQ